MKIDKSRILFEDEHLLCISKRSGELVVAGKGKMDTLPLLDFLKKDYPTLRAAHRLDFETSGVLVFAKTKEVLEAILDSKFEGWKKIYQTLVMGRIERKSGTINMPLESRGEGRVEAITKYIVLDRFANSSYVECEMITGRHHQIRKHFAAIHHPLVLDELYGHKKFNSVFAREFRVHKFFLHASSLTIPHPVTKETLRLSAPLPIHFSQVLKKLRSLR